MALRAIVPASLSRLSRSPVARPGRGCHGPPGPPCLFIEDVYQPMDAALLAILRERLAPHLDLPEPR